MSRSQKIFLALTEPEMRALLQVLNTRDGPCGPLEGRYESLTGTWIPNPEGPTQAYIKMRENIDWTLSMFRRCHPDFARGPETEGGNADLDPSRQQALAAIAAIAHCGGLAGIGPGPALMMIRRITLPYWERNSTRDQIHATIAKALPK